MFLTFCYSTITSWLSLSFVSQTKWFTFFLKIFSESNLELSFNKDYRNVAFLYFKECGISIFANNNKNNSNNITIIKDSKQCLSPAHIIFYLFSVIFFNHYKKTDWKKTMRSLKKKGKTVVAEYLYLLPYQRL